MIDELVERYCVTTTHDTLVCEFHQLSQEKASVYMSLQDELRKFLRSCNDKFREIS